MKQPTNSAVVGGGEEGADSGTCYSRSNSRLGCIVAEGVVAAVVIAVRNAPSPLLLLPSTELNREV